MKQRIRVSAKAYQQQLTPAPPQKRRSLPSPAFTVRRHLQKATRRRRNRRALAITLVLHGIGLFWLVYTIQPTEIMEDTIVVDFVEPPREKRQTIKPKPREVKPLTATVTSVNQHLADTTVKVQTDAVQFETPEAVDIDLDAPDSLRPKALTTDAKLNPTGDITPGTTGTSYGTGRGGVGERTGGNARRGFGGGKFLGKGQGTGETDATHTPDADLITKVEDDQLGAVLEGNPFELRGHIRIVRLKHSLSDWWQDPTAIPSFAKWLRENTQLRADMTYAGGSLPLTDDRILNAPMVIMTGHDTDIATGRNLNKDDGPLATGFTRAERAQLRKYIVEREGLLFFDDCGFNGNFAAIVQNELQRTFPEYPLNNIDHTHELYTIYYQLPRPPRGGDVFWGNLNKGDSGGYFATESQFRFQKGITINRRLAILFNRKDYLCTMETAEVGSRALLRMRRSNDVHRFMTNMLIYQMTYGGNTDRTNFKK